jgi:hypothetical protein
MVINSYIQGRIFLLIFPSPGLMSFRKNLKKTGNFKERKKRENFKKWES